MRKRKKVLFLFNPNAGTGSVKNKIFDIIAILTRSGFLVTAYATQSKGDAAEFVKENGGDYEKIIVAGGDGTLNEVITGIMALDKKPVIGYLPTGSTNDFATSANIPKHIVQALDVAINGVPFECDIGDINGTYFNYVAAFGAFTDVSYDTPQAMKNVFGYAAYLIEGLKRLPNLPSYQLTFTHDGKTVEDDFIFGTVTNSISVAGFKNLLNRQVLLDDGIYEMLFIKNPVNFNDLRLILGSLASGDINSEYIYSFKSDKLLVSSQTEIPWTVDGEFAGSMKTAEITNHKRAVTFMVKDPLSELANNK